MTHSLHRIGSEASLERDYVVLITPAAGINHEGSAAKLKEILDFIAQLGPTNIGGYETGSIYAGYGVEDIKHGLDRAVVPRVRCCFSDLDKVKRLVEFVRARDYGLSVTVSGLVANVRRMCAELGVRPHSVNLSLGFHGRTDLLPESEVLEIVTMCGHGMLGPRFVSSVMDRVSSGQLSPREGARELARPCVCGIFNVDRAEQLLTRVCQCSQHRC
ncbi:MAG: hypothetical protein AB1446_12345 [Bacillota bacterium]